MKRCFQRNWRLYGCEALGLAIFMVSACFFGAMLEGHTRWHAALPDAFMRTVLAGVLMGATALVIFYSPFTRPSGSQINPAVTLVFLRLKRMGRWDAFFYIVAQVAGGTLAVYGMAALLGPSLTEPPVNYAATVPMGGVVPAALVEAATAFVLMSMVLFTSASERLKKYTRIFSACFVCLYVVVAGPVSGFGMNPARSLASAIPSGTWTAFWIYALVPIAGMLLAAEAFLRVQRRSRKGQSRNGATRFIFSKTKTFNNQL